MATWDKIALDFPESVAVVSMLEAAVLAGRSHEEPHRPSWSEGTRWKLAASDVLADAGDEFGFLGVGLLAGDRGAYQDWEPTVFVGSSLQWVEHGHVPLRLGVGEGSFGGEALVRVVGVPRASPLAGSGDRCETATEWGTLGARVTVNPGVDGVLIAGHVAIAAGTVVTDGAGARLGVVGACVHPGQFAPQVASGDIAVVELDGGVVVGGVPHSKAVSTVLPRDDVEIHGAKSGVTKTWIRGISRFWAGPDPSTGDWASVLVTRDGTTDGGDSGALALRDGTDYSVGHVVGGVPGVYTLIQELDDQL